MFLFLCDLFIIMHGLGRKQFPAELCSLLVHIKRQCFQVRRGSVYRTMKDLGSNSKAVPLSSD